MWNCSKNRYPIGNRLFEHVRAELSPVINTDGFGNWETISRWSRYQFFALRRRATYPVCIQYLVNANRCRRQIYNETAFVEESYTYQRYGNSLAQHVSAKGYFRCSTLLRADLSAMCPIPQTSKLENLGSRLRGRRPPILLT